MVPGTPQQTPLQQMPLRSHINHPLTSQQNRATCVAQELLGCHALTGTLCGKAMGGKGKKGFKAGMFIGLRMGIFGLLRLIILICRVDPAPRVGRQVAETC